MLEGYRPSIVYFLSRPHRLACLQMPKVACSSFRTALALLNHPELTLAVASQPGAIQRNRDWSDAVGPECPELREFFRFTFVRDPIARFVSFYRSKIARLDGQPTRPRFQKLGYSADMSATEVFDRLARTPAEQLDDHVIPQSAFILCKGRLQIDFIGRLERLAEDVKLIEARVGAPLQLSHQNRTINARSDDARAQITPELRQRLEAFYAADFALLGYEP